MISDMKSNRDPSQYAGEKKMSIQHYLVKLIDRIVTGLDKNNKNEVYAVMVQYIDWSLAFDRQSPKLAIQSFIKNGVRKCLIPVLISFFQDRQMTVKWKDRFSTWRKMPGGGPQGCRLGQESYLSQSNDNADCAPP